MSKNVITGKIAMTRFSSNQYDNNNIIHLQEQQQKEVIYLVVSDYYIHCININNYELDTTISHILVYYLFSSSSFLLLPALS